MHLPNKKWKVITIYHNISIVVKLGVGLAKTYCHCWLSVRLIFSPEWLDSASLFLGCWNIHDSLVGLLTRLGLAEQLKGRSFQILEAAWSSLEAARLLSPLFLLPRWSACEEETILASAAPVCRFSFSACGGAMPRGLWGRVGQGQVGGRGGGGRWLLRLATNSRCLPLGRRFAHPHLAVTCPLRC